MIRFFLLLSLFVCGLEGLVFAAEFDHEYNNYKEKISKYISVKNGLINYKQIKIHSRGIANFLEVSSKITKDSYDKWDENQKLSFLINLYNVSTIKLIIDNYPINSIKEIDSPWDLKFIDFLGSKISLNNIENELIRKSFDDPRIHFALVCAAKGCAVLRT
ncbi:MAG: DUF547 domain-containing protein, partial [Thermodesulfobacteriota bacterium]